MSGAQTVLTHSPRAADVFRALGDPVRLSFFERVCRGPMTVSELAKPTGLTLAAALQHVQILERSGLIRTHKKGRVRTCRARPEGLKTVDNWILMQRAEWASALGRLDEMLAGLEMSDEPPAR